MNGPTRLLVGGRLPPPIVSHSRATTLLIQGMLIITCLNLCHRLSSRSPLDLQVTDMSQIAALAAAAATGGPKASPLWALMPSPDGAGPAHAPPFACAGSWARVFISISAFFPHGVMREYLPTLVRAPFFRPHLCDIRCIAQALNGRR